MATELLMPKLGMTMTEGTIVQWFKKPGETVKEGETLVEILTDKVNMEVEAPASGEVIAILANEGDVVEVNVPIAAIGQPGEKYQRASGAEPAAAQPTAAAVAPAQEEVVRPQVAPGEKVMSTPAAKRVAREENVDLHQVVPITTTGIVHEKDVRAFLATPLARKLAQEAGVDLAQIAGTGPSQKITRSDVENFVSTPAAPAMTGRKQRLAGLRRVIAQKMTAAWAAPHVTLNTEVIMTGLVEFHKKVAPSIEKRSGVKPSYNDLVLRVTARALHDIPGMNARLVDDQLEYCDNVNLGMAIGMPSGLIVPVLQNADRMSLEEIARTSKDLAQRAREGRLSPDEMSGGTFTVTNLGMFGVDHFTPILNKPEIGILGVGRILEKPVVVNGEISVQSVMSLSLSFDHRAVDGVLAAQLLKRIKELCEDYWQLL